MENNKLLTSVDKSAIVSQKAKLGSNVLVGPGSIIGDNVTIGDNTQIGAYCVIEGNTCLGKNCKVFTGAVIGSAPQDLKYKGEKSFVVIGDNNIFREYITVNPGTTEGAKTIIGSNNLLMAYSHVAHDCTVGNDCIIANSGTLAGHVEIHDRVVIGGLVAIHQFCRVGKLSIIGGCSKVVQDIPPFSTCDGHPAKVYGVNLIGLRRSGVENEEIAKIKQAFKIAFFSGLNKTHVLEVLQKEFQKIGLISDLFSFIQTSQRGICKAAQKEKELV
jgi:UDP-N-acetylglucosamine acyltransferase